MSTPKKIRIPIAFKLVTLTTLILVGVVIPVVFTSVGEFEQQFVDSQRTMNLNQARSRSIDIQSLFESYGDKVRVAATLVHQLTSEGRSLKDPMLDLTFNYDEDLVAVEVVGRDGSRQRLVNDRHLKKYNLGSQYIDQVSTYMKKYQLFHEAAVFAGQVEIRNASLDKGAPLIMIGRGLIQDENEAFTHIAVGYIRLEHIQKIFKAKSERQSFLVDRYGRMIAHPDDKLVFGLKPANDHPVVRDAIANRAISSGQKNFMVKDVPFTGAFGRTAWGPVVIVQASQETFLEVADKVKRLAVSFAGYGVSGAFFLIFLFSITLTAPIEKLGAAARRIATGDFSQPSQVRSHDEVGDLGEAFDQMVSGLQERDKMRNVLNKFHGSTVTEDLLRGDLALGGRRKDVCVFFSDIRDFTKFSEGHTAEEVVEMLNEYFQIMVKIIANNHGVVDKFIGDAIMAVWGAPESTGRDAQNAVKACLEMRQALAELNELRQGRGQVPIKIGMGLHFGAAISGTIGSQERMEYTVIGDTVNQASRIESATKAFGTDLLLSQDVVEAVGSEFVIEKAGSVEVKGKSQPLTLHKVRGFVDAQGQTVLVRTPYSDYEAGEADKVKVA